MASKAGKCTHAARSSHHPGGGPAGLEEGGAVREAALQGGCWCQDLNRRMVLANLEPPRQRAQQSQRPWREVPDVSNQEAGTAEAEGRWRRRGQDHREECEPGGLCRDKAVSWEPCLGFAGLSSPISFFPQAHLPGLRLLSGVSLPLTWLTFSCSSWVSGLFWPPRCPQRPPSQFGHTVWHLWVTWGMCLCHPSPTILFPTMSAAPCTHGGINE